MPCVHQLNLLLGGSGALFCAGPDCAESRHASCFKGLPALAWASSFLISLTHFGMAPREVHWAQLFASLIGQHLGQMASFEEERGQGGKSDSFSELGLLCCTLFFPLWR